eukprot:TRINITY_DN6926_c0_g1_i2.p1 TRINITY_DN6926_c0_g1~~TRINITY_DN6926_c0_g1_i2.p1  ORF type:complete len:124 (-),score=14.92 TRINITY_DN6926_c0_g1_i2:266-637(-)
MVPSSPDLKTPIPKWALFSFVLCILMGFFAILSRPRYDSEAWARSAQQIADYQNQVEHTLGPHRKYSLLINSSQSLPTRLPVRPSSSKALMLLQDHIARQTKPVDWMQKYRRHRKPQPDPDPL